MEMYKANLFHFSSFGLTIPCSFPDSLQPLPLSSGTPFDLQYCLAMFEFFFPVDGFPIEANEVRNQTSLSFLVIFRVLQFYFASERPTQGIAEQFFIKKKIFE